MSIDFKPYQTIRHLIRSGDMLEWAADDFVGKSIRFFTGKIVNHTSMCVAMDKYLDYEEPHKFVLEANPAGIELRLISEKLSSFKGQVYWSQLKTEDDYIRDGMARWGLLRVGTPYDFGSLFKNALGAVSANARKLFCSEYYFLALKEYQLAWGDKAPRPGEFGKFNSHYPPIRIF